MLNPCLYALLRQLKEGFGQIENKIERLVGKILLEMKEKETFLSSSKNYQTLAFWIRYCMHR